MEKILLVTDTWSPQVNGVVTTWKNVGKILKKKGFSLKVLHPFKFRTFSWPAYKEIKLPIVRRRDVYNEIETSKPDYIHIATEGILGWIARGFCMKNQIEFSTSYHTKFPEFLNSLYKIPESLTYSLIRKFHLNSSVVLFNTKTMIEDLSIKGFKKLILWTRGIDRDIFKPIPNEKLRKSLDPTGNKTILLYVGRVSKEKNIKEFCRVVEQSKDFRGVVVGDGPTRKKLENQHKNIIFAGYKFGKELAEFYSTADCSVFPSLYDTFGNTILESIACGTPVAAFNVNGPKDLIEPNLSGFFDQDLNTAIDKALLCSNKSVIASSKRFNWETCTNIFLDSIRRISLYR